MKSIVAPLGEVNGKYEIDWAGLLYKPEVIHKLFGEKGHRKMKSSHNKQDRKTNELEIENYKGKGNLIEHR